MTIYKETMYKLLKQNGLTGEVLSKEFGKAPNWLAGTFSPRGWHEFDTVYTKAFCQILHCNEKELGAKPYANEENRPKEDTYELIVDGFKMIHADLQHLVALMNRYWGGEETKKND